MSRTQFSSLLTCSLLLLAGAPLLAAEAAPTASLTDAALFAPQPVELIGNCIGGRCLATLYSTSPGGGAASHWGHGSTCTAAKNDLASQLFTAADDFCFNIGLDGACSVTVVYTPPYYENCWQSGGQYIADGYATFKCYREPICIEP